jgi:hypothetical protein
LFRQNPYKGWAVLTRKCGWEIGAYTLEGKIDVYERANTGFRFITSYSIIKNDIQNITRLDERFIEVEFGEYPQEPVEAEKQGELDSDTFQGKIYETGKRYSSNDIVYNKPYCLVEVVDEEGNTTVEQRIDEDATFDIRQEEIAKRVILYPAANKIVEDMAAVAEIISTECMIKSGFGDRTPQTTEC